jgi:hypothetical protein
VKIINPFPSGNTSDQNGRSLKKTFHHRLNRHEQNNLWLQTARYPTPKPTPLVQTVILHNTSRPENLNQINIVFRTTVRRLKWTLKTPDVKLPNSAPKQVDGPVSRCSSAKWNENVNVKENGRRARKLPRQLLETSTREASLVRPGTCISMDIWVVTVRTAVGQDWGLEVRGGRLLGRGRHLDQRIKDKKMKELTMIGDAEFDWNEEAMIDDLYELKYIHCKPGWKRNKVFELQSFAELGRAPIRPNDLLRAVNYHPYNKQHQ